MDAWLGNRGFNIVFLMHLQKMNHQTTNRHPIDKPPPKNFDKDLDAIRRAGTIKWGEVESRFAQPIDRINNRRPSLAEENPEEAPKEARFEEDREEARSEEDREEAQSEEDRDESMPISSETPSLVDQLRIEKAAKLAAARSGEGPSETTEAVSASDQMQQLDVMTTEAQLDAVKEKEQLEAARIKKRLEATRIEKQLEAAREKKAGKKPVATLKETGKEHGDAVKENRRIALAIVGQKAQQREAVKQKEQLEVDASKKKREREQQRDAAKQKEQLEAAAKEKEQLASKVVEQTRSSKKRSAEETDADALEAAIKRAKTISLSHAKEGAPMFENPRACTDLCMGVSSSKGRLPEFREMDAEAVYEEYARSSVQAITAANELFGRLKRSLSRCSAAQSQEDQMKEAMAKAKTAYRKEYERSKHLEDEWKKMKLERDGVVAELEKAKEELEKMNFEAANEARFLNDELNYQKEDLVAAKEELVAVKEELNISREREKNLRVELRGLKVEADKTLLAEQTRLRNSREFEVNAQIKAKNDLRERCQAQFDKIRSHLEKRRESENAVGLHAQAKGTREVLQYMKSEEILDVPDSLIASFVAREERYLANCNAVEQIELLPCDLVVSEGSESIPLEAEAGVVGHGTNVELIDPVVADGLKETDAPGNELADGDASQK